MPLYTPTSTPTDGSVTNAKVNASAAIAYSKLNLATSVDPGDLDTTFVNAYDRDLALTGIFAPTGAGVGPAQTSSPTGQAIYLLRIVPSRAMSITKLGFAVSVIANNNDACDVGIYNSDLSSLLVSSGATSGKLNATGVQTITVSSTPLTAGTVYYAAFVCAVAGTAAVLHSVSQATSSAALQFFGASLPNAFVCHKIAGQSTLTSSISSPSFSTGAALMMTVRES